MGQSRTALDQTPGYVEAVVRFVECKSLSGGVKTTQGIPLFSNQGIAQYCRGIVRNVEQTEDAYLPEALSHLANVEAVNGQQFFARLQRCTCLLWHPSEGTDEAARSHFTALHLPDNTWAITPALAGIHSLALEPEDFQIMQAHSGAMIWSPLSNLLLYGKTADVKTAKQNGVRIGIGSDWSPSDSKNLLGELKVAHLYSAANGNLFTDRELLSMVTRTATEILQWEKVVGSIEAGKRADLLVVARHSNIPMQASSKRR
jgi:5-methylthioadenosine/S-adenosylhomocysteine deaminase